MVAGPRSPAASARVATSRNEARRDGTGRPSWSTWVGACDDETVGVDRLAGAGEPADVGDHAERDPDVGDAAGQARAVHHPAALDDRVEHGAPYAVHPMYLSSL